MCIDEIPETTSASVRNKAWCREPPSSECSSEADMDDLVLLPSGLEGITEGGEDLCSTPKAESAYYDISPWLPFIQATRCHDRQAGTNAFLSPYSMSW